MFIVLIVIIASASCKKDKDGEADASAGSFTYQSKTTNIAIADYRSGNGDGAWIYFSGDNNTDFVQIRFAGLANYVIPLGTITIYKNGAYDPLKNFKGGQVIINNVSDEFIGATLTIAKNGDEYTININATTLKGTLTTTFKGTLKKI